MAARGSTAAALGLMIFVGILLIVFGATLWSVCSAGTVPGGAIPNCSGYEVLVIIGVLLLVVGGATAGAASLHPTRTIYPSTDPAVPPPIIKPVVVQQTIVQQTVEVRCRYCGALNPVTGTKCSSCGAAL